LKQKALKTRLARLKEDIVKKARKDAEKHTFAGEERQKAAVAEADFARRRIAEAKERQRFAREAAADKLRVEEAQAWRAVEARRQNEEAEERRKVVRLAEMEAMNKRRRVEETRRVVMRAEAERRSLADTEHDDRIRNEMRMKEATEKLNEEYQVVEFEGATCKNGQSI